MKNHWLDEAKFKRLFKEIDDIAMEIWADDGTLADLFNALNDEQAALLMGMRFKECGGDLSTYEFDLILVKP